LKLSIAHGIVSGMNYLHSLHEPVIHSDLKPENVLIGEQFVVKVSQYYSSVLFLNKNSNSFSVYFQWKYAWVKLRYLSNYARLTTQ